MRVHARLGWSEPEPGPTVGRRVPGYNAWACRAAVCVVVWVHGYVLHGTQRCTRTGVPSLSETRPRLPRHRPWESMAVRLPSLAGSCPWQGQAQQDCQPARSLYDKPTRLLFTGIRNWRICRCYSVPQWGPARLAARMAAHFHFSRPHRASLPRSRSSPAASTRANLLSPSIERPRACQPRDDHTQCETDPYPTESASSIWPAWVPLARPVHTLGMCRGNSRQMHKGQRLGVHSSIRWWVIFTSNILTGDQ